MSPVWAAALLLGLPTASGLQDLLAHTEKSSVCICPESWECKANGLCVPPGFNTSSACAPEGPEASLCSQLVGEALDAGRNWLLVISDSTDKESVVAADTITNMYLKDWRTSVDAVLARLKDSRSALGDKTYEDLQLILSYAWENKPFQQVDIAKSQCYDRTERAIADASHRKCFYNLVKVMSGSWVQRSWFPQKVVSSQSRYIGSMARAADYVRRKTGREMWVDVHLLELFPNLNSLFFKTIKLFAESQYRLSSKVLRMHLLRPLKGTEAEFAAEAGLSADQIVYEDLIPVATPFMDGSLPKPGDAMDVVLQAYSPAEEAFLGDSMKEVNILPEDTVTLVTFSAQPNPATLKSYVEQLAVAGPLQRKGTQEPSKGLSWVFIDTGAPDWREHGEVYNSTADRAAVLNAKQEDAGGRVRLMPFSHQVAQLRRLKGRADMIITYGGNFPAGELLAMSKRGDNRHIVIEVGGVDGLDGAAQKRMAAESWWERQTWEQTAYLYMQVQERRNYVYLARTIDATLASPQTFEDAWEDGGMKVGGFCPELGACTSQLWDGAAACTQGSEACKAAVEDVLQAARGWTLLLTSSGGGGHMVAAGVLGRQVASGFAAKMDKAEAQLQEIKGELSTRAYESMRHMVAYARNAEPVEKIDVMSSPCTALLGEHGLSVGKAFSNVWNLGQSLGSVKALTGMSKVQGFEDDVFHRQCQKYVRNVLAANRLTRVSPPSSIVSCQPMQHAAVATAIHDFIKETGLKLTLDIHLTELPTRHSVSFFDPLRDLAEHFPEVASHVRLHTVAPVSGGADFIAERTGLNASQVTLEENMPVDERLQSKELAGPGEATNITLKATNGRERRFLGRDAKVFDISADDRVTLLMLGSQPTVSTMRDYVERFLQSTPKHAARTHWVFLAAGDPKVPAFERLYASLADLADRFNFLQRMTDGNVRMVPFTRQSVSELESRADVTLTRSGGITSGELLAMSKRGDKRQILLHLEVPKNDKTVEPEADSELRKEWERAALTDSMVEWEMGNALFLKQVLNATLVTPKKLPSVW